MSKKDSLLTSQTEVAMQVENPIPRISQPMLKFKYSLYAEPLTLNIVVLQVENPIPFADLWTARLTTGFLHAKYFHLLLFPLHLSADWSYACVPYVQSLVDPRNAATAAVYAAVLWVVVSCKPWQVVSHILDGSGQTSHSQCKTTKPVSEHTSSRQEQQQPTTAVQESVLQPETEASHVEDSIAARHQESVWQMVVVVGLVIAPFSPAANVLFYVGTFIAERLLYLPSFGYCLLLAHYLTQLIGPHVMHTLSSALSCMGLSSEVQPNHRAPSSLSAHPASAGAATSDSTAQHDQRQVLSVRMRVRSWLGFVLLSVLLMGYSWRTVTRNLDWEDEETLFVAAQKVSLNKQWFLVTVKLHQHTQAYLHIECMGGAFLMQVTGRSILNWDVQTCQVKHQKKLLLLYMGTCGPGRCCCRVVISAAWSLFNAGNASFVPNVTNNQMQKQ